MSYEFKTIHVVMVFACLLSATIGFGLGVNSARHPVDNTLALERTGVVSLTSTPPATAVPVKQLPPTAAAVDNTAKNTNPLAPTVTALAPISHQLAGGWNVVEMHLSNGTPCAVYDHGGITCHWGWPDVQ